MNDLVIHDDRDTIIAGLREQLRQCREELATERARDGSVADGASRLRQLLGPLYGALGQVFGEIAVMDIEPAAAAEASPGTSRASAVWASWKEKLPGIPSKMIDALLLHGGLTQEQLRLHVQCARNSVSDGIYKLNKAGLIIKGGKGGKITLKEL